MRGKVKFLYLKVRGYGITPAYAGKSMPEPYESIDFWDHPRVCGEKYHGGDTELAVLGSPPRMRGKEVITMTTRQETRITPAYAGKSTGAY